MPVSTEMQEDRGRRQRSFPTGIGVAVKPAPFDYRAPRHVSEALDCLREFGDDAKLLAGGQSLAPLLNLRLAAPAVLVDLNRVPGLDGLRVAEDGWLVTGAMCRQRAVELSPVVAGHTPVLQRAIRHVAHPTIRNRGTIGGSLSHADPVAEIPTTALAMSTDVVVASPTGRRVIPVDEFFVTYLTVALAPDELVLEIRWPPPPPRSAAAWQEYAPRRHDYPLVGLCLQLGLDDSGAIERARAAVAGGGDRPTLADVSELTGQHPERVDLGALAATITAQVSLSPDRLAPADYKAKLLRVLTARCFREILGRLGCAR